MADALDELESAISAARRDQAWLSEANALLASELDVVRFSCANPPYRELFVMAIPRSVWAPILEQAVADAQARISAVTARR